MKPLPDAYSNALQAAEAELSEIQKRMPVLESFIAAAKRMSGAV